MHRCAHRPPHHAPVVGAAGGRRRAVVAPGAHLVEQEVGHGGNDRGLRQQVRVGLGRPEQLPAGRSAVAPAPARQSQRARLPRQGQAAALHRQPPICQGRGSQLQFDAQHGVLARRTELEARRAGKHMQHVGGARGAAEHAGAAGVQGYAQRQHAVGPARRSAAPIARTCSMNSRTPVPWTWQSSPWNAPGAQLQIGPGSSRAAPRPAPAASAKQRQAAPRRSPPAAASRPCGLAAGGWRLAQASTRGFSQLPRSRRCRVCTEVAPCVAGGPAVADLPIRDSRRPIGFYHRDRSLSSSQPAGDPSCMNHPASATPRSTRAISRNAACAATPASGRCGRWASAR